MKKAMVFMAIVFLSISAAQAQEGNRGGTGSGMMGRGNNSSGSEMMGGEGYGSGSGMMGRGGNGMNSGMMGQGYSQGPECQKFYDETASLRKELHEKKFEYLEIQRNTKAPTETSEKLNTEIKKLQEKISAKAPADCRW